MRFKIWLESMESAEDIFKRISQLILSAPNYQAAIQNLSNSGINADFDTNRHGSLGHKWSEALYAYITGDKGNNKQNPELDRQLGSLNSQILSLGFKELSSSDPFYFFGIPEYVPDGAKNKIHTKIPTDRIDLALELAKIIKQNSAYVRQFKFSSFGGSFESRRDNFVIYLSKQGEENVNDLRQKIASLGLPTDTGQDFKGERGSSLSQTQLVSLRLAAMLVSKPGSPQPKFANSSHWQLTEKEFLMQDPIGSRYLKGETSSPSANPSDATQSYQPKTLVLSSKGRPITINVNTQIGKRVLQQSIGDEAQYFSDVQFSIQKSNDGWYLVPNNTVINKTVVNGSVVTGATKIKPRDQIGISGKSGKQIIPLTVTSV